MLARYISILGSAAICVAIVAAFSTSAFSKPVEKNQRYMVAHAKGKGAESLEAVVKSNGKKAKKLKFRDIIAADLSDEDLAKLLRHPLFVGAKVEPDPRRYMQATNSVEIIPYGISLIEADADTGLAPGSSARKVCIIDSGYDLDHPDLPDAGSGRVTGMSQTGDSWSNPGNSHGTHVAGTIAALGGNGRGVVGVHRGTNLSLHIVKVFNDNGSWTNGSDLIEALDDCVANGSDIVSMSLGGGAPSSNESTAFAQALANNGVLSIAAASNDGDTSYSYPASYSSVVSVAAVDSSKNLAYFSNRNDQVELAAPGVNVDSTVVGGGYASYNGTSMATPHVSGAAALLWSNQANCTAGQIRQALAVSAEDLGAAGPDDSFGYGLIKVNTADALIDQYGCSNLPPLPTPPPPPEVGNGEVVSDLAGARGTEMFFSINLPAGSSNLSVRIAGGSGDADLYLRAGDLPSTGSYDCRPYLNGNNETCSAASPTTSDYYIMIRAYSEFSGVTLSVSYDEDNTGPPVNQPPVADISASVTSGKAPLTVEFDGSGSSDDVSITSWIWVLNGDNGETASDSGEAIAYTFNSAGIYTVELTVSDGEFTDTDTVTVIVAQANRDPLADFTVSPASGIDTDTVVSFDASNSSDPDDDALSYSWDFGGDGTASGRNASHTFSSVGGYNVQLTVNDGDGGSATKSQLVTIVAAPEPPPSTIVVNVSINRKGNRAEVSWAGAGGSRVEIYRNNDLLGTTRNDGVWRDRGYSRGDSYKVCETSGSACSDDTN